MNAIYFYGFIEALRAHLIASHSPMQPATRMGGTQRAAAKEAQPPSDKEMQLFKQYDKNMTGAIEVRRVCSGLPATTESRVPLPCTTGTISANPTPAGG